MELCMGFERALKSSLRRELSTKSTLVHHQQVVLFDDLGCVSSCDDFSVDDLLDFSNGEFQEFEDEKDSVSVDSQGRVDDDNNSNSSIFSSRDQSLLTADELVEPVDEIAELEWVSRFVDDSSRSELSILYPNNGEYRFEPVIKPLLNPTPCFPASFPSKARTKRSRPATRVLSQTSSPVTDSPISSSSSSGSTITSPVQASVWCNSFTEPEAKKQKKKPAVQNAGGGLFQRRCTHCQTQKTPQWRTGPLGPKTLCNACGVRFKSGRLFPEYRPACSPTFSGEIHSNSHRKVLEMRKKKETSEPEVGLSHMVESF